MAQNFRDVGSSLKKIEPNKSCLSPNRIFRSGQIDFLTHESLGSPSTIINLRMLKDEETIPNVKYIHFPIANNVEVYNTRSADVRKWLHQIVKSIEDGETTFPVLIHCFKGKDRTGVVVAALLHILGVPSLIIINEFVQSDGTNESDIRMALVELDKKGDAFWRGIKLDKVRRILATS